MSNYTQNQYVKDENNSWSIVFELVKDKQTVLDIGCSSGNFGAELINRKACIVDGIDMDEKDVKLAQKKLRNAYVQNVESDNLDHLIGKYDAVLMMDVIEHLVTPVPTLKKIATLLKPGGSLIFSVPNMAHISVRLDLLLGDLDYRNTGLLDDTHLHFYSEKTLLKVLKNAGYTVDTAKSSTVSYPKQLVNLKLEEAGLKASPKFEKMIEKTKGNVYQLIGTAQPSSNTIKSISFPDKNPHEEHYLQIERAMNDQSRHLRNLEGEIQARDQHIKNVEERLQHIVNTRTYKLAHVPLKSLRKAKTVIKPKKKKG